MTHSPTVLILAAGANSRFFPFNTTTHKGGIELVGQPLIFRTLKSLESSGFHDVVIIVSEKDYDGKGLSGVLKEYHSPLSISFVLQPEAKGMGNAVLCAKDKVWDSFAIVFPVSLDAGPMIQQLITDSGEDGALVVSETKEPWLYGIVTTDGKRVTHIVEKPAQGSEPSNLKAEGVYLLSKKYLDVLSDTQEEEYSFEKALDSFFKGHDVRFSKADKTIPSLKYPWHLFGFKELFFQSMHSTTSNEAEVAPTVVIDDSQGPVVIESGAKIGHAAKLSGPCFIGKNVLVGDFSFVRNATIEHDAVVGSNTEIVRSIIGPHTTVHYGYVADSIIGSEVKIGAGLITANRRHDRANVHIHVKDGKVDSGSNGFGVMIGDRTKVGVRTTTMPGVVIGADCTLYPSITHYRNIDHNQVIK
jgi:NDP-sugar pyrophosphorylase family protein